VNSYRLQLTPQQGFDDAARRLPFLARLGATIAYTSPYFMAGSGSSGYDVCDHMHVQPELGGEEGFARFVAALRALRLGHLIDVVPNHMGADTTRNGWWRDVLQHGARSKYAGYFDVDWDPVKPELRGRILLPILEKPYGLALEDQDIRIVQEDGDVIVHVSSQRLPTQPGSIPGGTSVERLTPDEVHTLLERQVYRLAHWRTASDEINYRRFFDVGGLIGLRMEEEEVFRASHARIAQLVSEGVVTGIRVDHPDGLARPAEYFQRLRSLEPRGGPALHIVAEKILTGAEHLPPDWAADGTTGYEFVNVVNGLFVHPVGANRLRQIYARVTRRTLTFDEESYQSKKTIMSTTMASEVHMLAHRLNRISERHPRSRDFTLNSLRHALAEIVASLPVYRTYITSAGASADDIARIRRAAALAMGRNAALEPSVFRFIVAVILTVVAADEDRDYPPADDLDAADRRRFTERFQQFTGSVFAKGVEDTAFYRYQPLLSLNEVGGDPATPARTPASFHASNQWRAAKTPRGLLTTATHDTKLGEDARARINVLSELAEEWGRLLTIWRRTAKAAKGNRSDSALPIVDANDAYRFYQALIGTYPAGGLAPGDVASYTERLVSFMRKSIREAKIHSSWLNVNDAYESAVSSMVTEAVARLASAPPTDAGAMFVARVSRVGVVNSLAQLVLKLGSPGVVDIYQGTELWDLNLVDPDNRRPVNFDERERLLASLEPTLCAVASATPSGEIVREVLEDWRTGAIKMFVTAAGLRLRRDDPDLFLGGAYEPVEVAGERADRIVAYMRRRDDRAVLVVAPRLVSELMDERSWPVGEVVWADTVAMVPEACAHRRVLNRLTGETLASARREGGATLTLGTLLRDCPVGVFSFV
jgi:(1->4)-alpha-D-glucan 1-alpha-D-glucosylmutase